MTKSKACFKVMTDNLVVMVPVSYLTIIMSRDYETSQAEATRLALSEVLNRRVSEGENARVIEGHVYDEAGYVLPPGENEFTVNEHGSGFSVTHNESGQNHWLSDGVDSLTAEDGDGEDVTLKPGTLGFLEFWNEVMNNDSEALDAYFPDLVEREEDTSDRDEDAWLQAEDRRGDNPHE